MDGLTSDQCHILLSWWSLRMWPPLTLVNLQEKHCHISHSASATVHTGSSKARTDPEHWNWRNYLWMDHFIKHYKIFSKYKNMSVIAGFLSQCISLMLLGYHCIWHGFKRNSEQRFSISFEVIFPLGVYIPIKEFIVIKSERQKKEMDVLGWWNITEVECTVDLILIHIKLYL